MSSQVKTCSKSSQDISSKICYYLQSIPGQKGWKSDILTIFGPKVAILVHFLIENEKKWMNESLY